MYILSFIEICSAVTKMNENKKTYKLVLQDSPLRRGLNFFINYEKSFLNYGKMHSFYIYLFLKDVFPHFSW